MSGTNDPVYETVTTDRAGYEQLVVDRDRWKERSHELEAALKDLLENGGWGHHHWDSTRQFGAGCEVCIQQREAKARARAVLASPEART